MKTPCIAACKNNDGICSGCHRTMDEIIEWRHYDDQKRQAIMDRLSDTTTTHQCPSCGDATYCDISTGESECWCFTVEKRDLSNSRKQNQCLCRNCLSKHPVK